MKKFLMALLLLACSITVMSLCYAQESPSAPGWIYNIKTDEQGDYIQMTAYTGTASHVTVPAQIDGVPVNTIGRGYNDDMIVPPSVTCMTIPEGVKEVHDIRTAVVSVEDDTHLCLLFLPRSLETVISLPDECLI